jgi:hypothetical protein
MNIYNRSIDKLFSQKNLYHPIVSRKKIQNGKLLLCNTYNHSIHIASRVSLKYNKAKLENINPMINANLVDRTLLSEGL